MARYLLSTGRITEKKEKYVLDCFRLFLTIRPGDIPGAKNIGFNFVITDTKKDELLEEIRSRVESLISSIKSVTSGVDISLETLEFIDDTRVRVVVKADELTEELNILVSHHYKNI